MRVQVPPTQLFSFDETFAEVEKNNLAFAKSCLDIEGTVGRYLIKSAEEGSDSVFLGFLSGVKLPFDIDLQNKP